MESEFLKKKKEKIKKVEKSLRRQSGGPACSKTVLGEGRKAEGRRLERITRAEEEQTGNVGECSDLRTKCGGVFMMLLERVEKDDSRQDRSSTLLESVKDTIDCCSRTVTFCNIVVFPCFTRLLLLTF